MIMSKIEEILCSKFGVEISNISDTELGLAQALEYEYHRTVDVKKLKECMEEYAKFKLEEFENSKQYLSMVEDCEWLYYLECAGVDNWNGFSIARQLQKEAENE